MRHLILSLSLSLLPHFATAQPVRAYLDLQMHPTMHLAHGIFGRGFRTFAPGEEPKLRYKHQFRDVNYANYWRDTSGARIITAGLLTKESVAGPRKARRVILRQLEYIEDFVAGAPTDFALARSPEEVRTLLRETDKTIILLSIEGGKHLINSAADAEFWAARGIAFVTLLHLVDSDLGAAAIKPGFFPHLINWKGALRGEARRGGLTEKGRNAIGWLADAGILTDLTHMAPLTRYEALEYMEAHDIPPIVTHDVYRPIQNQARGLYDHEILRIYRLGGFISLPVSGYSLATHRPAPSFADQLDSLTRAGCYCEGSVDTYRFTYEVVQDLIESNFREIAPELADRPSFSALSEGEKERFSIGFQSDFNGWLNHSRPRVGPQGCFPREPDVDYSPIEIDGMPHPGYLDDQWRYLESEGMDLAPLRRNAERFLQVWERVRQ